jgi:hypothetical protein
VRFLLASLFLVALAPAQTDTASLTVVVSDQTGALIQKAVVTVTNQATNIAVTVTGNDKGYYFAPDLRPVQCGNDASGGFKLSEHFGIALQVGQTARIDVRLDLGDAAEKVTGTAEASVLYTETSDRGSVIDEQKIVEISGNPSHGLAALMP